MMTSIQIDPYLANILPKHVPLSWSTRAIYTHPHSYVIWQRNINDGSLEADKDLLGAYNSLLKNKFSEAFCCISIGAAGGGIDKQILENISTPATYIPIDISENMLRESVTNVAERYPVPAGLVGDIEESIEFIKNCLRPYAAEKKLYLCTGGLIGNADLGEKNAIDNIAQLMAADDLLLLSFGICADKKKFEKKHDLENVDTQATIDHVKDLMACACSLMGGENVEVVEQNIHHRIEIKNGSSDVPGAVALTFYDRELDRSVMHLRHYDFSMFQNWLNDLGFFQVLESTSLLYPDHDLGVGVLLLKKI